jgi:hypothetical protein
VRPRVHGLVVLVHRLVIGELGDLEAAFTGMTLTKAHGREDVPSQRVDIHGRVARIGAIQELPCPVWCMPLRSPAQVPVAEMVRQQDHVLEAELPESRQLFEDQLRGTEVFAVLNVP